MRSNSVIYVHALHCHKTRLAGGIMQMRWQHKHWRKLLKALCTSRFPVLRRMHRTALIWITVTWLCFIILNSFLIFPYKRCIFNSSLLCIAHYLLYVFSVPRVGAEALSLPTVPWGSAELHRGLERVGSVLTNSCSGQRRWNCTTRSLMSGSTNASAHACGTLGCY